LSATRDGHADQVPISREAEITEEGDLAMLTSEDIRLILNLCRDKTITLDVGPYGAKAPATIRLESGYSSDPKIASLQGKLSIMLEAATRAGR
jgi:hypothetical protein